MMTAEKINFSKSLTELLNGLANVEETVEISGVAIDSRSVKPGDLFMAYRGSNVNGIDYISDAIKSGAVAIVIDAQENIESQSISAPVVKVNKLRNQVGTIVSRFYNEPSSQMAIIGITGTNGKTTISYMVAQVLSVLEKKSAVIGTIGNGQFGKIESANMTTPDPVKLHSLFNDWRDEVDYVVMEVSSHALDQGRVAGTQYYSANFNNLIRDNLDYHETIEAYADAKFQLFKFPELKHAIVNIDDSYGLQLINQIPDSVEVIAYSKKQTQLNIKRKSISFVYCDEIQTKQLGTLLKINLKAIAGSYASYFGADHTQRLNEGINGWVASYPAA
ncbi:MAG: Mur ligase family protein [Pseudomonadota bacterium]